MEKKISIIAVCLLVLLPLGFVVYMGTNHNFGTRCEKVFERNTMEYEDCVYRLVEGGRLFRDSEGNAITPIKKVE